MSEPPLLEVGRRVRWYSGGFEGTVVEAGFCAFRVRWDDDPEGKGLATFTRDDMARIIVLRRGDHIKQETKPNG